MQKDLRIVFMGTPEFAVASLDILVKAGYNIAGVITAPDKPAGRGRQLQQSAVKKYALAHQLHFLQPEKLKEENFLHELKALKADLQVVVAFRMLPEAVWNMPPLGTFNLHASLLPLYRGAAPINHVIINGETETGVTTFFLNNEIDKGKVIFQSSTSIGADETAGELHDRLMVTGAELVLKTVKAIEAGNYPQLEQNEFQEEASVLKLAPKIFKEDCHINWKKDIHSIYNHIRGLSPHPGAFTEFVSEEENKFSVKVYKCRIEKIDHQEKTGEVLSDYKTYLKIAVKGGFISLTEIQMAGKNRMNIGDFLRGFNMKSWKILL